MSWLGAIPLVLLFSNFMDTHEPVAIFWDYENCSPQSNAPGFAIANNIRQIAHRFGSVKLFKAYLELSDSSKSLGLRSELQSCGVSLTDCPHNGRKDVADKMMIVDMLTYAIDTPAPTTIILISGDRDFVYAVSVLRLRRYRVVLVAPNATTHISLRSQASEVLDWDSDVLGKTLRSSHFRGGSFDGPKRSIGCGQDIDTSRGLRLPTTPVTPLAAGSQSPRYPRRASIREDICESSNTTVVNGRSLVIEDLSHRGSTINRAEPSCADDLNLPVPRSMDDAFSAVAGAKLQLQQLEKVTPHDEISADLGDLSDYTKPSSSISSAGFKTAVSLATPESSPLDLPLPTESVSYPNKTSARVQPPTTPKHQTDAGALEKNVKRFPQYAGEAASRDLSLASPRYEQEYIIRPASAGPVLSQRASSPVAAPARCFEVRVAESPVASVRDGGSPAVSTATVIPTGLQSGGSPDNIPRPLTNDVNGPPQSSLPGASPSAMSNAPPNESHIAPPMAPIPAHFVLLVQLLDQARAAGLHRIPRSTLALQLIDRNKNLYKEAGVIRFKQYAALAEQAGMVELGGWQGDAWISLRSPWHGRGVCEQVHTMSG